MATKRGMCPYCKNNNYFLVNPEAMSCFCGTNMHQISPIEAIEKYNSFIDNMINKANDTLEVVCDPYLAYQEYAEVIELDDSIVYPYFGRILCLIYMSKVRKSHINNARALLEASVEQWNRKNSEFPLVVAALKKISFVTEEYLNSVYKSLTLKQYFYDLDCLTLYLTHVEEVMKYEIEALEIVTSFKKRYSNEKVDALLNYLDEMISEKERILKDYEHILVNGEYYKYVKTKKDGSLEIVKIPDKKIDTKTSRYRMASLDANNKKARYIKDEVFKDYTKMIRARKASFVWFTLFYLISIGSGVCVYIFKENPTIFLSSIVGVGLFFVLGTIFLCLNLSWGAKISKKRRKLEAN